MNAIRMLKHVDSAMAEAIPELRELIGQDVEITVRRAAGDGIPSYETLETFLGDALNRPPPS